MEGGKLVSLTKSADTVQISIDGSEFGVYRFGKNWPKPHFAPLRAADGTIVTRDVGNTTLLPEHRGVWMSFGDVDGVNFWGEEANIENVVVHLLAPEGNPASFEVLNYWKTSARTLLVERSIVTVYANRLIEYDAQLSGDAQAVMLGDNKEGLFAARVAPPLSEEGGGRMVSAEGLSGVDNCRGKTSNWIDFYGDVYGEAYGVAILNHPANPRPARFQVTSYGLLAANPLADSALTDGVQPASSWPLAVGESLHLRYAVYVHKGDTRAARVAEVFDAFRRTSPTSTTSQSAAAGPAWTPLFDGDLSRWQAVGGPIDNWKIAGDVLYCPPGQPPSALFTRKRYDDFELMLGFRVTRGANSGVFLRAPLAIDASQSGMELQILDDRAPKHAGLRPDQFCGSIYGLVAPSVRSSAAAGVWQTMHVVCRGDKLSVRINGALVVDADLAALRANNPAHQGLRSASGYIGLQYYGVQVDFRNIKIRQL